MQKVTRSAFEDCETLDEKVDAATGLSPRYGPYSSSRLNMCDFDFRQSYPHLFEDEAPRPDVLPEALTRFGRGGGQAVHKGLEVDTSMRMQLDKEDWFRAAEIADRMLEKYPQWDEHFLLVRDAINLFRQRFEMNEENYVGSEEYLACTLDLKRARFEDDSSAWYRGVIDYLEINEAGTARVTDHKNYPTIMRDRKVNGEGQDKSIYRQQMGYVSLVFANYPSVDDAYYEIYHANPSMGGVTKQSSYRDDYNERQIRYITREEVEDFWKQTQYRMIRQEQKESFHPQPSSKRCQYCDHVHKCPFWMSDERDIEQENLVIRSEEKARERLEEYIVLDEQRTRLDKGLKSWAKENGPIEIQEGGRDLFYGYKPQTREKAHSKRILQALAKDMDLDEDESVERFIEKIAPKAQLTKGSSKKVIRSIEDDDLREDTMEEGYVRTESTRKTKDF